MCATESYFQYNTVSYSMVLTLAQIIHTEQNQMIIIIISQLLTQLYNECMQI